MVTWPISCLSKALVAIFIFCQLTELNDRAWHKNKTIAPPPKKSIKKHGLSNFTGTKSFKKRNFPEK